MGHSISYTDMQSLSCHGEVTISCMDIMYNESMNLEISRLQTSMLRFEKDT